MSAVDKAAEVLAAHVYEEFLGGLNEVWTTCTCGERIDATFGGGKTSAEVFKASWGAHVAQALADAGLLIAAFPDGTAGTLTGDLLTDMAAYARRLKDRAEAAERALATLREDVAREIEADRSLPWNAMHHEALRAAARIARGPR